MIYEFFDEVERVFKEHGIPFKKPQSIAELAELTGRAQPNLTRTLGKLEAVGFVRLKNVARRKVPTTTVHSLRINIDPFSQNDRLELA